MNDHKKDILILSNGPGEITAWVHPVVKALREELKEKNDQIRISVILSPCPNNMGTEKQVLDSFQEIDRSQKADYFFDFLLWGKTQENWDWYKNGVVVFLGGDQIFPLIVGKRLGYQTVIYAEWEARWYQWIDYYGVMKGEIISKIPQSYHHKLTVVGDLMADISLDQLKKKKEDEGIELIGILPGSKPAKLAQGMPLMLSIAEEIKYNRPQTRFILPVAPTLTVEELSKWADPDYNKIIEKFHGAKAELIKIDHRYFLHTSQDLIIELITQFPAYHHLAKCDICLTTVGANTAQLGALGVPMVVLLPTQQLDAMRSWDGLPGLLANLPLVGTIFARIINWTVLQYTLKSKRLYAWPNIYANQEIVPELVGNLQADEVAQKVVNYLENPQTLREIRDNLLKFRGAEGAAKKFAILILKILNLLNV
jgi:lipid A disaccharide synthetase